jgi:hypothetical protein
MRQRPKIAIPSDIARKIGYYVYLYIDPRNQRPLYVGKGKGVRVLSHLALEDESSKTRSIRHIRRIGLEPQIDILAHGLPDEETAFRVEAAVIDALGLHQLTNQARGWRSVQLGRMPLRALLAYYRHRPAILQHPVMLIRINRLYSHGMPAVALYEATRGVWKVNPKRAASVRYALATFEGIVREVYSIERWVTAGSTRYQTRKRAEVKSPGRWEFIGRLAPDSIRRRYLDHSVRRYLPRGLQSPIVYVEC